MNNKTIFIGSSSQGIEVAESIQILLSTDGYDPLVWNQGIFGLGKSILEELVSILHRCDFGIFVLRGDDLLISNNQTYAVTRDNVLFELGLFIGHLGPLKTFIICDKSRDTKIIADLSGIIYTTYDGSKPNLNTALGPAVSRIKQQISEQLKPQKVFYTEWHLGQKKYLERLYITKESSNKITGTRVYQEHNGETQLFNVQGFEGEGFYWLEYHLSDGTGGGTILLHNKGTGNYDGLITAARCSSSILRCYKNRWKLLKNNSEAVSYDSDWLVKLGEYQEVD